MKKVRISAKAVIVHYELVEEFENPIENACSIKPGMEWISENAEMPEGFCASAWMNLQPFVFALASGAENLFDGWMKDPKSAMISCNDGFRPVSFYLEALDD